MIIEEGNVNVHHRNPGTVVGKAIVDEIFLPLVLKLGPWYLGDVREASSPRISFYIPGTGKKLLPLSRLIATLIVMMKEKNSPEIPDGSREMFWFNSQRVPAVKFFERNPFDCRLGNLLIGFQHIEREAPSGTMTSPKILPVNANDLVGIEPLQEDYDRMFGVQKETEDVLSTGSTDIIGAKGSTFMNDLTKLLKTESKDSSPIVRQASNP